MNPRSADHLFHFGNHFESSCRNSSQQLRSENQQLNSSTLSCELYTYSISAYLIYAQTLFVGILAILKSCGKKKK